jgi:hypothetical protein
MGRRPGNTLEKWEIAIVKAMLARKYVPQSSFGAHHSPNCARDAGRSGTRRTPQT